MSWLDFYLNSSGNNLNSGTTCADAGGSNSPSYTSTSGNFDGVSLFTPTDGQTTSTLVSVGDWISLYNTGDTVTRCVAKVSAVGAGVNGTITIDTTNKYGTVPVSNSGSRNCRKGGALADFNILNANAAFATGTVPVSTRFNPKAGTYANAATARNFNLSGTTTTPIQWRGYKAAPGDLDSGPGVTSWVPGTDTPQLTWTSTNGMAITSGGAHQIFTNIAFLATSLAGALANISAISTILKFHRCRFENQSSNAAATAFSSSNSYEEFTDCYFKCPTTATRVVFKNNSGCVLLGCEVVGGIDCVDITTSGHCNFSLCCFRDCTTYGISSGSTNTFVILNCSFRNTGSDAIRITTIPAYMIVANCVFSTVGGYAINNATGTNTNVVQRLNYDYFSCTSGAENGFGDSPSFNIQTDSADPFVSSTNLSLVPGSNANATGAPGLFEGEAFASYLSRGAVQPAAGVPIIIHSAFRRLRSIFFYPRIVRQVLPTPGAPGAVIPLPAKTRQVRTYYPRHIPFLMPLPVAPGRVLRIPPRIVQTRAPYPVRVSRFIPLPVAPGSVTPLPGRTRQVRTYYPINKARALILPPVPVAPLLAPPRRVHIRFPYPVRVSRFVPLPVAPGLALVVRSRPQQVRTYYPRRVAVAVVIPGPTTVLVAARLRQTRTFFPMRITRILPLPGPTITTTVLLALPPRRIVLRSPQVFRRQVSPALFPKVQTIVLSTPRIVR